MLLKRTSVSCALLVSGLCLTVAADPPQQVNPDAIYQKMWSYFMKNPSSTQTIQEVYNHFMSQASAGNLASITPMAPLANVAPTLDNAKPETANAPKAEPAIMPLAPAIEPNPVSMEAPLAKPVVPALALSPPSLAMNPMVAPAMPAPFVEAQTPHVVAAPLIPATTAVYSSVEALSSPISPAPLTGIISLPTATSLSISTAHPSNSSSSRFSSSFTRSGMPSSSTIIPPVPSQADQVSLNGVVLAFTALLVLLCHL